MDKLQIIFNRLANEEYLNLSIKRKRKLYENFNIDCGLDYARYILTELIYNKDGASIY